MNTRSSNATIEEPSKSAVKRKRNSAPSTAASTKRKSKSTEVAVVPWVKIYCVVCDSEIRQRDATSSISCHAGHYICKGECCDTFVGMVLSDPHQVPLKCSVCRAEIN